KGRNFDLTIKLDEDFRSDFERLKDLPIDGANGVKVPFGQIAELISSSGPNTINRENVQRNLVVSANTSGRDLRSVVEDIQERIAEDVKLPEGYYIQYGGQFESEAAASRTLLATSVFSIILIFLFIYNQFRDTRQSAIIMLNLP